MKEKRIWITSMSLVLCVAVVFSLLFIMKTRGKETNEETNKTQDMIPVDRGAEKQVKEDTISYLDQTVSYQLPDGFYFDHENSEIESGNMKEYMNHNFNKMIELSIYQTHVGDYGIIDSENPENTKIYKNITVDAKEWFRQMRLVYLERDEEADIQKATIAGKDVTYFTRYEKSDDGYMIGMVVGFVELEADCYYCVKVVEYDYEKAPEITDYKGLFTIQ